MSSRAAGAKEDVDWRAPRFAARHVQDIDVPVIDLEALVRRNDVNVIRLNTDALFDFGDRKQRHALKHLRQLAVVIRREM